MLDIKFIRENKDKVEKAVKDKQVDVNIDELLAVDIKRREKIAEIEDLRAKHNKLIKQGAEQDSIERAKALKSEIKNLEAELNSLKQIFDKLMFAVPNLAFEGVPVGKDESYNVVVKEHGKKPKFNFEPKDHLALGEELGLIDMKRASKISGSRFSFLKRELALMEFALINFAFEKLTEKKFLPIIPPVMIKPEMMQKMGYIDREEDKAERYFLEKDNLVLVGTAEQAIGPMHAGEVFEEKDLPKRYAGFSTCFREEAGSHGKDTRGILRQHQFDKIEMFSFCHPDNSQQEHNLMLSIEEAIMKDLKLPYRLVHLCTSDMARVSASTFDIETWMPGQDKYRETHSCSNCTDFQARRLNIRYRDKKTNKQQFVHMLNGTAIAIGRTLIAIMENYQKKDGTIDVPKVLQRHLGFQKISS